MMTNSKVANRYALSLLDLAIDKNKIDKIFDDAGLIIQTFDMSRELQRAVESPVIKPDNKISVLDEVFGKRVDKDTLSFIHFLIKKRRDEILYIVFKCFVELRNEHLGIVGLQVNTAFELSDDQKTMLSERYEKILKKKVIPVFKVDKNIVGGFVARVGDTVYDASLMHQLELLKKEFVLGSLSFN